MEIAAGVPVALARWRARHYRDVRYALRARLAEPADRLRGSLQIQVELPGRAVDLVLDWRPAPRGAALRNEPVEKVRKRSISNQRRNMRGFVGRFEHCRCRA